MKTSLRPRQELKRPPLLCFISGSGLFPLGTEAPAASLFNFRFGFISGFGVFLRCKATEQLPCLISGSGVFLRYLCLYLYLFPLKATEQVNQIAQSEAYLKEQLQKSQVGTTAQYTPLLLSTRNMSLLAVNRLAVNPFLFTTLYRHVDKGYSTTDGVNVILPAYWACLPQSCSGAGSPMARCFILPQKAM